MPRGKANQKRTTKLKSRALSSFPAPGGRSSTVPNPQRLPLVVDSQTMPSAPRTSTSTAYGGADAATVTPLMQKAGASSQTQERVEA